MKRLRSIRSILVLAFTFTLLVPLLVILFYTYTITGQALAEQAIDRHLHDVVLQAQHIEQSLDHIRDDAAYLTRLRSLRQLASGIASQDLLQQDLIVFATANPMIQRIVIVQGSYRVGLDNSTFTPRLIDADVLQNSAYDGLFTDYRRLSSGQYAVTFDLLWDQPVLRYSLATDNGLIILDVAAGWIFRNMPEPEVNRIWAVLNQNGQHLLFPLPNETYDDAIPATDDAMTPYLEQFQLAESGTIEAQSNMFIYSRIYPANQTQTYWLLYQQVPQSDLYAVVNDFYRSSALVFVMALVVAILLSLFIARQIVRPLHSLQANVRQFAQGKTIKKQSQTLAISELHDLHRSFHQMASQLDSERQQKRHLIKRLITAQEDERKRIAYDLHDGLIQQLVGAKMYVAMLKQQVEPGIQQDVIASEDALKIAIIEGRRIIEGLHPTILDDLGLVDAIAELANQQAERYGWELKLDLGALPYEPDKTVAITVFRIIQEALNNVGKHARATRVEIILSNGDGIHLSITDNGTGFNRHADDFTGGLGTGTMIERAHSLSGTCSISSYLQQGTTVTVQLPYD